jgi:hypothetical protein
MFKAFMPSEQGGDEIIDLIRGRAEIIRGDAYAPQTERRIREVQGRFDNWYAQRVSIAPTRAVDALRTILQDEENALNEEARLAIAEVVSLFEDRWQAIRAKSKHEYIPFSELSKRIAQVKKLLFPKSTLKTGVILFYR